MPLVCAVSIADRNDFPRNDGTVGPPPTSSTTVPLPSNGLFGASKGGCAIGSGCFCAIVDVARSLFPAFGEGRDSTGSAFATSIASPI
jgi:hypothetical protein